MTARLRLLTLAAAGLVAAAGTQAAMAKMPGPGMKDKTMKKGGDHGMKTKDKMGGTMKGKRK